MKKSSCNYAVVPSNDIKAIVTSADPLNSSRLPIGVNLTVEPQLRLIPASGVITDPWQAIMLVDDNDEAYFVSPRVFLGLAFQNKKFTNVQAQPFPKKPLIEYMATRPTVQIVRYNPVSVDVYNSEPLKQVTRDMPEFVITSVEPKLTAAEKKALKEAQNATK